MTPPSSSGMVKRPPVSVTSRDGQRVRSPWTRRARVCGAAFSAADPFVTRDRVYGAVGKHTQTEIRMEYRTQGGTTGRELDAAHYVVSDDMHHVVAISRPARERHGSGEQRQGEQQ